MKNVKITKYLIILIMLFGSLILLPNKAQAAECSNLTPCGLFCSYGGVQYDTVKIGSQCWLNKNLNAGSMITNFEVPDNTAPTVNNPNTVSKWCYNDSTAYCDTEGGLYTWAEANAMPDSCNSISCILPTPNQGICPAGWHIPSDAEFYTLENYLTTPGETCDATRADLGCSGAGTKLRLGGNSGFDALGAGNHETTGVNSFFDKREPSAHFWSSSPFSDSHAYNRYLGMSQLQDMVGRGWSWKAHGFSVRCLSDTEVIGPPTDKAQCKKDGWKVFNYPTFKNQGDCVSYLKELN